MGTNNTGTGATEDKLEETIASVTETIEQAQRCCRQVAAALEKSRIKIRAFDERLRRERLLNGNAHDRAHLHK